MKRIISCVAALLLALTALPSAEAAFVVGGENGWQFSTDGFVNVFGLYQAVEKMPVSATPLYLGELSAGLPVQNQAQQQFSVRTGLLPTGFGFNIKAPTTKGVDYAVRLGIYPQIQNHLSAHTDITPNVDFREVNITADGSFGQVLAGRAINLYQAKNILTDMTLFGAGVIGPVNNGPTMGHIGYGYLYPNFDAQFRYTTPSLGGVKIAVSVNDTSDIGGGQNGVTAAIHNVPCIQSEISYATTFTGGKMQTWVSGLYQTARFPDGNPVRPSGSATALGGAGGIELGLGGLDMLVSGYGGQALGMLGMLSDGLSNVLDATGKEHQNWGFLAQATYMLTPELKLGANYGQSNQVATDNDKAQQAAGLHADIKTQQAATCALTYNVNKFVQLIAEYTWAQDKWQNGLNQSGNMGALGTFFYW